MLTASTRVLQADKIAVHLRRRPQIKLVALHFHAAGIGSEPARVDAQHHILSRRIIAVDVVAIAGRHQRQPDLIGHFDRTLQLLALDLKAVVHDFDEVTVAKEIAEPTGNLGRFIKMLFRSVAAALKNRPAELTANATAQTDNAFVVSLKQLLVDARLEVKTFQRGRRCHLDQVLKTRRVLAQQRQVVRRIAAPCPLGRPAARRDVGFVTNDRIDANRFASVVELKGTVQITVIRQRQRVHAMIGCPLDQFLDRASSIKQAVMAVAMEVNKRLFVGHQAAPAEAVGFSLHGESRF